MNPKHIRLAAILGQALYCLAIFIFGIASGVPFFYTFIGPAALLCLIAFFPRFYYDIQLRDTYLANLGLRVLRFDNRQVLLETESVVEAIAGIPPLCKRGSRGDFPHYRRQGR